MERKYADELLRIKRKNERSEVDNQLKWNIKRFGIK
jgi:hypothetical protein